MRAGLSRLPNGEIHTIAKGWDYIMHAVVSFLLYNLSMTKNKLVLLILAFFSLSGIVQGQEIPTVQRILYSSSPIKEATYVWDGANSYCEIYPFATKGYCQRGELRGRYGQDFTPNYSQMFSEPRYLDLAQYGAGYGVFGVAYPDGSDTLNTNSNYYNKSYSNRGYSMIKLINWTPKRVPFVDVENGASITAPLMKLTHSTNAGATAPLLSLRQGAGNPVVTLDIFNESDKGSVSIKTKTGLTELKNESLFINSVDVIKKLNEDIANLSHSMVLLKTELQAGYNELELKIGASIPLNIKEITADYILQPTDDLLIVNCSCKINFPDNFPVGKKVAIKNIKKISLTEKPISIIGKINRTDRFEFRSYMRAVEFVWDGDEWFSLT